MNKELLYILLFIIILVSGCVGGSTNGVAFSQTAGAVINEFSFDTNQVFEGDDVTLTVQVQNVGAKIMSGTTRLWIYGPVIEAASGAPKEVWKLTNGKTDMALSTNDFAPPDVERRIPGNIVLGELGMTAPQLNLPPGMDMPFKFIARMCYSYSTSAFSSVNEISKNELRISNPPTSDAITRATAGPIQLKLLSGDTVLSGKTMTLVYEISNVGGGFPTLKTPACSSRKADILSNEMDKLHLVVTVDGKETSCGTSGTPKDVNIKRGGNVACTYSASSTNPTTSHTVIATATYNYILTQEADMTVKSGQ